MQSVFSHIISSGRRRRTHSRPVYTPACPRPRTHFTPSSLPLPRLSNSPSPHAAFHLSNAIPAKVHIKRRGIYLTTGTSSPPSASDECPGPGEVIRRINKGKGGGTEWGYARALIPSPCPLPAFTPSRLSVPVWHALIAFPPTPTSATLGQVLRQSGTYVPAIAGLLWTGEGAEVCATSGGQLRQQIPRKGAGVGGSL